jgi:hypothetical protein
VARLSKREIANHRAAEQLLTLDRLNDDQRQFVLDNWNEGAEHMNAAAGAFFTPSDLALDAALMAGCCSADDGRPLRVIDLCAGIGTLGLAAWWRSSKRAQVTCVEVNPAYVAVGRKLFPEAEWICASVNQLPSDLGGFDVALANPPFGKVAKITGPRYSGEDELAVVDIASDLARWGGFILPVGSLPFSYSGNRFYQERENERYQRFTDRTGIELSCESVDCSCYADGWRGVSPRIEVVTADFDAVREARSAQVLPIRGGSRAGSASAGRSARPASVWSGGMIAQLALDFDAPAPPPAAPPSIAAKPKPKAKAKPTDAAPVKEALPPVRDELGERILAEGLAPNEFLLGLNGLSMPYDRQLTAPWDLPSRLFRFPIETSEAYRDRDGVEHPRRIGLMHPLLAEHPWVREVEQTLGIKLDPNGAPNPYGYTKTRTGLWWHAVDLMTAGHWRDLLATRQFTTDVDIVRAVEFGLRYGSDEQRSKHGRSYITVREAREIMAALDRPRPTDGSVERAWSTVDLAEFKGEGGKLQRAINWRDRDATAIAWASIEALERGWFKSDQSGFLKWTDAAKAPNTVLL